MKSVFTEIPAAQWVASNELTFAIRDRFPVSLGHTLVITRRVVPDYFAASAAEQQAMMALVDVVKRQLDEQYHPDGYNVGFNAGSAAGQTVPHVHVHVIPRFTGDVEDPRGGVRYVIPARANYLLGGSEKTAAPSGRANPLTDGQDGNVLLQAITPLLQAARRADILAAFVQDSGLVVLEERARTLLLQGARLRILTGDYLDITQAQALRRLLDWMAACTAAAGADDAEGRLAGVLQARIIETAKLHRAFHPKAWIIENDDVGTAFVGSSNLSYSALRSGVEWNLRIDRYDDRAAWQRINQSFERLWESGTLLTERWVADYLERVRRNPLPLPAGEVVADAVLPAPAPTALQREALAALVTTRAEGRQRAVVVMATGLGKTFLVAFDLLQFERELGRRPRVLFLAHRRELLAQAQTTLRRSWPDARFGWFIGGELAPKAYDVLLASVQKLTRRAHLQAFGADAFDYVIIDEVHHAAAPSYRSILAYLQPRFLLGLTATPERMDDGDILGLFDDHVAFTADLAEGIERQLLVPFRYFGLKDTADYVPIPWRNGRFDPAALALAVQTEARMAKLWEAWQEPDKRGQRTLVFCASIEHAKFVQKWLREHAVKVVCVHSEPDSYDRMTALEEIESGTIEAICSVDLFNEGIDCRPVDRVVMLRPTESPVIFMQQLGRGLRKAERKDDLVVIDFVGNHRVFLDRVRTLLTLVPDGTPVSQYLRTLAATSPALPPGCSVTLELEAIELLRQLLPPGARSDIERQRLANMAKIDVMNLYRELKAARGVRPSAGELLRQHHNPAALRSSFYSWFEFVNAEGDLDEAGQQALAAAGAWLLELETTPMTKCFKMVVLEVLLEADKLRTGMPLAELSRRSHAYLLRSPELFRDVENVKQLVNPRHPSEPDWRRYWEGADLPIAAWTGRGRGVSERAWFAVTDQHFVPRIPFPPGAEAAVEAMTRELVDYRLTQYRRRRTEPRGVVVALPVRARFIAYPTLRAAAGAVGASQLDLPREEVTLPRVEGADLFAVRAAGSSMNGGNSPIHDGDWLVLRWTRGVGIGAVRGRVALVAVGDPQLGQSHHLKRVVQKGRGWLLRSDNPQVPALPADDATPIALLVQTFRPEQLGPAPGTQLDEAQLPGAFGVTQLPHGPWQRVDGHLFLLITSADALPAPARIRLRVPDLHPGETAFVLTRAAPTDRWCYAGVGHWREKDDAWALVAADTSSV